MQLKMGFPVDKEGGFDAATLYSLSLLAIRNSQKRI